MKAPVWPVFIAALNMFAAFALFVVVSIGWHWPYNALPGLHLASAVVTYVLVDWAARGEGQ